MSPNELLLILTVSVGVTFLIACVAKLRSPVKFAGTVMQLGLSERSAWFLATSVIALEGALGLAYIAGWRLNLVAPASAMMLIGFLIFSQLLKVRAPGTPCMCFGASADETISLRTQTRLALLLLATIACAAFASVGLAPNWPEVRSLSAGVRIFASSFIVLTILVWAYHAKELHRIWTVCRHCRH